jgi:hypothetical protein
LFTKSYLVLSATYLLSKLISLNMDSATSVKGDHKNENFYYRNKFFIRKILKQTEHEVSTGIAEKLAGTWQPGHGIWIEKQRKEAIFLRTTRVYRSIIIILWCGRQIYY